jgi:G3E family GTPase
VIIETSGLADPGLILQRFLSDAALAPQIRINGIVTVFDAVFGPRTLDDYAECGNQVAVANQIAISKSDLVDSAELTSLSSLLRSVNPLAPLLTLEPRSPIPDSFFSNRDGASFAATPGWASEVSGPATTHRSRYQTFCLHWTQPIAWSDFQSWIEGLLVARGQSILRVKGLLHIEGCERPMVVQAVQHALYSPTLLRQWPHDEPCSDLVFITRDFSSVAALNSFKQLFPFDVSVR